MPSSLTRRQFLATGAILGAASTIALIALALLALPALAPAADTTPQKSPQTDTLAFERAAHLRRGVNLNQWFSTQKPKAAATAAPGKRQLTTTTPDDLRLIKSLGFDHVRLPVDATPLYAWQRNEPSGAACMNALDATVKLATQLDLAIIIDIHPSNEFKQKLAQGGIDGDALKNFAALWTALAARFAPTDPKLVFFEILNEPHQRDQTFNFAMHTLLAGKIRAAAPDHTIIACPGSMKADISGLLDIKQLLPFANIIYTFHNYKPDAFTHQGADWITWAPYKEFRYVPYPPTPENVAKAIEQVPTKKSKDIIRQYGAERWDAARMDRDIFTPARVWSESHGVPVYVGEFGVYGQYVDPGMRARCIQDMRETAEKNHLYWAMWDYQANFGMITRPSPGAKAVPDPAIVKALGLAMPEKN